MTQGRKPIAVFGYENRHIDYTARVATNNGVYVVESLKNGLYYFLDDGQVVIATSAGHMRIDIDTAELIAGELAGIIADYKANEREHRVQMNSRAISKMLEAEA